MYFDWITWSIWLTGLIIMVVWSWVSFREFKKLFEERKRKTPE